jgi:succinate dehydrogenase / fumarate reductase cytochrome b subunit
MKLFSDSIGRKVVMAVTGLLMVLFVIGHLLGNLSIFAGPNGINSYAQHLHELAPLVWGTRIVMGVSVVLHVILALVITTENWAAKPTKYAVKRSLRATFAGKTMIWTGIIIAVFVGYHLLQFTFRVTPGLTLGQDLEGRFDVFTMVANSFVVPLIAIVYVVAMVALFLHLSHGIQSTFQTIGVANAKLLPRFGRLGNWASVIFLVGFGAIPLTILFGILAR